MADRATIALALGQTLAWAGLYYAFPATLLRWEAEAGWSRVDLTGAMSLAVLVSALAAPVAGRIIDAGRGPAMMVGAAVLGGALMACLSQVHSLGAFYGIWAGIGLAMAGCLYEPCFAMVTRARGAQARGAITVITLVAGFAGTVSFPSLHALVEAYGLRSALVWAGVGVIALAAPLLWIGARGLGG